VIPLSLSDPAKYCLKVKELLRRIVAKSLHPYESTYNYAPMEIQDENFSERGHESQRTAKQTCNITADHNSHPIGPQPIFQRLTISEYQQASSDCPTACICKCHAPRRFKVLPHNDLFGSFAITLSAGSGRKSLCTETSCSRRLMSVAKATYRFPYWLLARIFCLTVSMQSQAGLDISLKTCQVVPDDADIMRFAKTGDLQGVRSLIEKRLASPRDVNATWNVPVLSVSNYQS
jgi:hypothetical protein